MAFGDRASVTAWLAALVILASGCSAVQYVRFEEPKGAEVQVSRSPTADGGNVGRVPGAWPVEPGHVYPCRIRFERETLRALGFLEAEIDALEREDHLALRGGLVAVAGGDVGQTLLLSLDTATVRAALLHDRVAVAWGADASGNARALLKVSAGGVPLDDPELAAHVGRASAVGKVLLCVAEMAVEVLLQIPWQ